MAAISVTRKLVQHCANTLNGVASKKGQGHTEIKQQKRKLPNEKPLGILSTITAFKQRQFETGQISLITISHFHIQ